MTTEITIKESNQVTKADVDNWLFGSGTKLTEPQKALFYQVALSFNLNPAKREVYAIPYGSNFNIIVGFEVYLKRAERTGLLEYWEPGVRKEDNEYIGYCTIKRRDREKPTTIEAWFNEYNQGNSMWKTKPRTMIRKVAIAQAFRMVFPDELGGMPYTADEIETTPTVSQEMVNNAPKPSFDELATIAQLDGQLIEKFLTEYAAHVKKPVMAVKDGAAANWEKFLSAFKKWEKKQQAEAPQAPPADDQPPVDTNGQAENGNATAEQLQTVHDLCQHTGYPPEAVCDDYQVKTINDLTADQAQDFISKLGG
jgi:hypothetical protein